MTAISYLQHVSQMSATETSNSSQQVNKGKVTRANKQRKDLQQEIRKREEQALELQEKLGDAMDTNFLEDVGNWLTGSDGGVGKIGDKMAKNAAEMERASKEIQIAQARLDGALQKLQSSQQDLSGRVKEREKAYDEEGQGIKIALG